MFCIHIFNHTSSLTDCILELSVGEGCQVLSSSIPACIEANTATVLARGVCTYSRELSIHVLLDLRFIACIIIYYNVSVTLI